MTTPATSQEEKSESSETSEQWIERIKQATEEGIGKELAESGVDMATSEYVIKHYLSMFLIPVLKVREEKHASALASERATGWEEQHKEVLEAIKRLYDNWPSGASIDPDHGSVQQALAMVAPKIRSTKP